MKAEDVDLFWGLLCVFFFFNIFLFYFSIFSLYSDAIWIETVPGGVGSVYGVCMYYVLYLFVI